MINKSVRNALVITALIIAIAISVRLVQLFATKPDVAQDHVLPSSARCVDALISDAPRIPAHIASNDSGPGLAEELIDVIHPVNSDVLHPSVLQEFLQQHHGYVADYQIVTVDGDSIRAYLRDPATANEPRLELLDGYLYESSLFRRKSTMKHGRPGWRIGRAG